jgi:hypothetical protein
MNRMYFIMNYNVCSLLNPLSDGCSIDTLFKTIAAITWYIEDEKAKIDIEAMSTPIIEDDMGSEAPTEIYLMSS